MPEGYHHVFHQYTVRVAEEVLSLPVHAGLSGSDLETIVAAVNQLCA